jgi:hypothetical protein
LISVESDADEAVALTDVNATADSPEPLPAESPQTEASQADASQTEASQADTSQADEPSAAAAPSDSSDALQQADELSTAEVTAPSDYARGGEDGMIAAQSVGTDNEGSDDTDKAGDQDTDKEEKSEPAVTTEKVAVADSPSIPAHETAKQTVADEGETKPAR